MMDDGEGVETVSNGQRATGAPVRRQSARPRIAVAFYGVPAWAYRYRWDQALQSNMLSSFRSIPCAVDTHGSNPMNSRRGP